MHIPASSRTEQNRPLLLAFGGNAWNADATALYLHEVLPECGVVTFHYRGYRPSTGRPSAEVLLADAPVIFDHVRQVLAPNRVVAVGFSIGSGVAAYVARERPVAGLILVTPFGSLEALARDLYWWAPVGLLLRHRMPVLDFVRDLRVPTALILASQDLIVPAHRSTRFPKVIPNLVLDRTIEAGHDDLYGRSAFADVLREALAKSPPRLLRAGRKGVIVDRYGGHAPPLPRSPAERMPSFDGSSAGAATASLFDGKRRNAPVRVRNGQKTPTPCLPLR